VNAAWYVKQACTATVEHMYFAQTNLERVRAVDELCTGPLLAHERYNIGEGYFFVNVTNFLIRAGPSFCARPYTERMGLAAVWSERLESVMFDHRNDSPFGAFSDYDKHLCDLSGDLDEAQRTLRPLMMEAIERSLLTKTNATSFCSITTENLMTYIENELWIILAFSQRALLGPLNICNDVDANMQQLDWDALRDLEIPGVMTEQFGSVVDKWFHTSTQMEDAPMKYYEQNPITKQRIRRQDGKEFQLGRLTYTTLYHKFAPHMCGVPANGRVVTVVEEIGCPLGDLRHNPQTKPPFYPLRDRQLPNGVAFEIGAVDLACVYDLVTSTDLNVCNGANCSAAAVAVDAFQKVLSLITPLRMAMVRAMYPQLLTMYPQFADQFGDAPSETCSVQARMASLIHRAQRDLRKAMLNLREFAPYLEASIVAPPRGREWLPYEDQRATLVDMFDEVGINEVGQSYVHKTSGSVSTRTPFGFVQVSLIMLVYLIWPRSSTGVQMLL